MFGPLGREGRPALFWGTVKATAAVAALATFATAWLASATLDRGALERLAGAVAPSGAMSDPVTTGSFAQGANGAKLDPCATQRRP